MKETLFKISLTAVMAAALVACGGGDSAPATGGNTGGSTETPSNGGSTGGSTETPSNGGSTGGSTEMPSTGGNISLIGTGTAADYYGFGANQPSVSYSDRASEVDPDVQLTSTAMNFRYFMADLNVIDVAGWKYANGTHFGYDLGSFMYLHDTQKIELSDESEFNAQSFGNGDVILGCWGSKFTDNFVIAPQTDLSELTPSQIAGKTFTLYSCDPKEFNGYEDWNVSADGSTINGEIPVSQLMGTSGFSPEPGKTFYYKAYKSNNTYFVIGKDQGSTGIQIGVAR